MSDQVLDVRRFMQILRRHKIIVLVAAALGLAGGLSVTLFNPPMQASEALVVLPPTAIRSIQTQVVVATSDPVLTKVMHHLDPPVSLQVLQSRVVAKRLTSDIISITARGRTAAQAEGTAEAVAESYVDYVGANNSAVGVVRARILESASTTAGTPLGVDVALTGGLGLLLGVLISALIAVAVGRGSRRLRSRDEMADAIGVPVLVSLSVRRPASTGAWTRLLEEYQPSAADAWGLRRLLYQLGVADARVSGGVSIAILSLSSDTGALAIGPQLAVFASSIGIPTALYIGPQQDVNATATLRAACAVTPPANSRRSPNLNVVVRDRGGTYRLPRVVLTIAVVAVDGQSPKPADTTPTAVTLLAVSAGAATGEQLATIAASAAADARDITGILVADPEEDDETTGRFPVLARPEQSTQPTRLIGLTMETRR